ncbi:MAG: gliding motility-associated C-terminal domain-containing protein [Chitinophagaceae bacterium]|nr:gliding motility-associated C-terminal domain-containing protein [Chitinophagaceae bacterium]
MCFVVSAEKGMGQVNILWADSCTTGSFYGKIVSAGYSDFSQVHKYPGGDFIAVGTIKGVYGQMEIQKNYCNVMRLDAAGNFTWSRFIGITDSAIQVDLRAYASVVTSNRDIVVVLAVNAPPVSGNYVIRLNSAGIVVWQKLLPYLNNDLASDTFKDIIETSDGGFLITGSTSTDGLFIKINGDGNLAWRRSILSGSADITAVAEGSAGYYLAGNFTILSSGFTENYIAKANKNNGDVEWVKWITVDGIYPMTRVTEYEFDHLNFENGVLALTGNTRYNYTGANRNAQIAVYIDENANLLTASRLENMTIEMDPANIFQGMLYEPNMKAGIQFHNTDSSDYYVFRLKNDNSVNWAWRIPMSGAQSAKDIKMLDDSSIVVAGFSRNSGANVSASLLKTSVAGKLENCNNLPFQLTTSIPAIALLDNNNVYESISSGGTSSASALDILNGNAFTWLLECNNSSSCRMSKIKGSNAVCVGSTNLFSVARGGNCNNAVSFSVNTSATVTYTSDSSASISFPSDGSFMVYANMQAACGILKDSMPVQVKRTGNIFPLGPDTVICPQNKIMLTAGEGFNSYLWQDGSTDSFFTAKGPGKYYLTATDVCGQSFSDTVNISAAPSFQFSIGIDKVKCNSESIQLNGPEGFINYHWNPVYNISAANNQNVIVNPLVDTFYTLVAEKFPGCFAFDTVNILVKNTPPIKLGKDTNLCRTETLLLNAGPGFVRYAWNDGETTSENLVIQPGVYSVTAYDANGCSVSDSITISNNFCVENIYVPNAFAPGGFNQLFKPVAFEPPSQYHFQVFTRWGQLVLETTDINKGWDGKINGQGAGTGVYLWVCTYRFEGKRQYTKKGTVVLVR